MRLALLVVLGALPGIVRAQGVESRPVPTPGMQAFQFTSRITGQPFESLAWVPPGTPAGQRLPALIVTDGYRTAYPAIDAARTLLDQGDIEPMVIISIGVPSTFDQDAWTRRRVYEFSPPDWRRTDPFGVLVNDIICTRLKIPAGQCTGGAPQFLDVITRELIPEMARRLPIDTTRLGLFGVSAGGFFASWAIFSPTSPFRNYIISSPAMAYGDGEVFRREAAFARDHKDLAIGVYMSSGSLEQDDPMLEGIGQIVSGHARFVAALRGRKYPSLRLVTEILPGLGHADNTGTTLVRGLRTLYAKPRGTP